MKQLQTSLAVALAPALVFALALFIVPGAHAQVGFGASANYDLDFENFGIGAEAVVPLEKFVPNLVAVPSFVWYFSEDAQGTGGDVSTSMFTVNADAHYLLPMDDSPFLPYVGAGLVYTRVSAEANTGFGTFSANSSDVSLNLKGGAEFGGGGSLRPFVQLTLADFNRLVIGAGVRFGR